MKSMKKKSLAIALLPLSLMVASCQTNQTMWAACTAGNDPWGTDGTYVLFCRNGVWEPIMTVQEYLQIRQGKKITIAPVPTKPVPTTTTTTTTAAPVTTTTSTTTSTTTTTAPVSSPSVSAINAPGGNIAGGDSVIITGSGFAGTTAVTIGGTAATSFTVDSATQITATTPAHARGEVDVTVTNGSGSDTLVNGYEYLPTPVVSSVTPSTGPAAGGTSVTISGSGFAANDLPVVDFGATAATSVIVVNDTTITAVSPAGSVGTVSVRVNTYGGLSDISVGGDYTYS
ncbi:MAG: IPT/TIG domain-containing protein [Acidimicrobiales bacterium]